MTEKEKVFDENCKKYEGIFLDFNSEEGKKIAKELELAKEKLNGYYNDKNAVCITSGVIKKSKIKNINPDSQYDHPYVNVHCAKSMEINAFAKKIGDDYYLGILKGVFDKLHMHVEEYVLDEEFAKVPEIGVVKPERMTYILTEHCFDYLIFHEFFHIMNGHCDYARSIGISELCEVNEECGENNMIRQTLEYDADCCSISSIVNEFFRNSIIKIPGIPDMTGRISIDSVVQFISSLLVSIYIFTSWMNVQRYTVIEMTEERLERMTHPLPGMRVYYMWLTVNTVLQRVPFYHDDEKEEILSRSLNAVFDFINRFSDIAYPGYVKQALNTTGIKHLQKVHDNWKSVREKLTVHYNNLAPYEEIDLRSLFDGR